MGDICNQDKSYWCPLASDDCKNIPKPCVLLVSGHAGIQALTQLALVYEVRDGKVTLVSRRQT